LTVSVGLKCKSPVVISRMATICWRKIDFFKGEVDCFFYLVKLKRFSVLCTVL
jgi:hypothetical protein